jgi:microsomal dipeptidase-like Zn-dependent dipeptidase
VIADLHCHYPMHLLAEEPALTLEGMTRVRRRPPVVDKVRAAVLATAARLLNHRRHYDGWRVDLDGLEAAGVRVVFSVLYEPFAEMDLDEWYGSDPEDGYFADLVHHLERVERALQDVDPAGRRHVIVRSLADLDAAVSDGRVAFLHCVEGGFHLGRTPSQIADNVAELARRGVVYVTLAHLFWRKVATNAPALPFLPNAVYNLVFRQPRGAGLTTLGEAAVRAMYEHRVLIDLSHMRQDAIDQTFALLDRLDRERGAAPDEFPVISSHAGYRFGKQAYMHDDDTIRRIAARDGVTGLILARHQLQDGRDDGEGIAHTVATLEAHVKAIHRVTGSHAHVGIGSDLDGFIRPTMSEIERAHDLQKLRDPLRAAFPADGDAILAGNALRVVRRVLGQR